MESANDPIFDIPDIPDKSVRFRCSCLIKSPKEAPLPPFIMSPTVPSMILDTGTRVLRLAAAKTCS